MLRVTSCTQRILRLLQRAFMHGAAENALQLSQAPKTCPLSWTAESPHSRSGPEGGATLWTRC